MIRRRINQGGVKGKRFQVSDVPDLSTSKGVAKENDEMRKLAMDLTSFSEEIQGKIDDVKALIPPPTTTVPTTTTGGGTPVKPPDTKFPVLEVWQDGTAIVIGTRVWDFHESSTVRFEVTDLGSQRARIRAHTKRSLNTMWGTFYGGYAIEVPATPGGQINHPAYIGKNSISQPFTVQKDRSLIHWVGDTMSVEPAFEAALSPSATSGMGFNAEKPKNELAAWTAYTQGITVSGSSYDVTTVKYRVTPNLQIFDPNESQKTTPHVTRIFLKNSPTIHPHVRVDDPVIVTSGNNQIVDPRTYTASMWFDLTASGVVYNMENLGASGTNIGEVYSHQVGDTFYLRRLRTSGTLSLQEDQNYITLIGSGHRYAAEQHSPGYRILMYDVPIGTDPETFWFRGIVPHGGIDMWISQDDALNISGTNTEYSIQAADGPEGAYLQLSGTNGVIDQVQFVGLSGTTVSWGDSDTIYISSEKDTTSSVDNCLSGVGSGEIYHDSATISGHTTYYLRKLLAGSGIEITTEMHDVVIKSTLSGVANTYDMINCASGTGTGSIYADSIVDGTNTTFVLRKILAASGISVETSGCDIVIGSTVSGTKYNMYAVPTDTDALIRLHGSDNSDDDVKIVGSGSVDVEYVDERTIRISAQDTNNTYEVVNCVSGTGTGLVHAYTDYIDDHANIYLRNIKAGQGIGVTTSGCDIIVAATSSGVAGVSGMNLYDCTSLSTNTQFGWYIDYDDNIEPNTRTLRFRTFGVQQDLYLSQCGNDYIFTVLVSGIDNRNTLYPSIGVFQKNVQNGGAFTKELYFRGLRPGSGISLYLDESDNKSDIVISTISSPAKYYDIGPVCSGYTGQIAYLQSGTRGTGNTLDDPYTFLFRGIVAGSGISIDNTDPCQITIGTVTASGRPTPILDRIYRARDWYEPPASGTYCTQIKAYEIYGRTDSFSGTYNSNYGPGAVSGLAYEVTDFKFRQLADFPNKNGVVLKMEKTSDALGNQLLEVATRNQNWQTSQDDCLIIDSTTGSIDRIHFNLPDSVWHPLFFEDINIVENYTTCLHPELRVNDDVRVFRNTLPGSVPYWYFLPLDTNNLYGHGTLTLADTYLIPGVPTKDTTLWQVTVRLGLITGSPTNDAGIGGVAFPQIALFRDETYWRNLDVDVRISGFVQMRQALITAALLDAQAANPRKVWLHGTALIQLQDGQSLTARYRHMTGSTRYHEVVEGSIDIIKVGMQNTNVYNTYTLSGTQERVVIQGYSF